MAKCQSICPNHIGFTVSDLDGPIRWLTEVAGFSLSSRAGRPQGLAEALTGVAGADVEIAWLDIEGLRLELLQYFKPGATTGPLPTPATTAAAHLALTVPDIDTFIAASRPHAVELLGAIVTLPSGPNRGGRLAYLRHAAGLFLELVEPPGDG